MREDQIVRYGRQILLRELGGRGQERLLASSVRVRGAGPAIDDAIAYLLAGGTSVDLAGTSPGGFLTGAHPTSLNPDAAPNGAHPTASIVLELVAPGIVSTAPMQVVVGAGVAYRNAEIGRAHV